MLDICANLSFGDLDNTLDTAINGYERKEAVISDIQELVLLALDIRDVHVMGGRVSCFELLASEDIDSNEVNLRLAVLADYLYALIHDLAGAMLYDDEPALLEHPALPWIGCGGTDIIVRHGED